jgi:hypothetical protein
VDLALGEVDLALDLRVLAPASSGDGRGDELGTDVGFAEIARVQR